MLVVTDLSAIRRAKQKPRQWGPLSSVASAVRWNADWLGLSAEAVKSVTPAWDGVGSSLIDPANAGDITIPAGGNEWLDDGLATLAYATNSDAWSATNALQHSATFGTSLDFPLLLAFSGVVKKAGTTSADTIATVAIDAYSYVRHRIYIDNSGFVQFQSSRTTSDAPQITYSTDIDDGKEHTLVFLALSDSERYAYVDGTIVGSDTTYIENLAGYDRVLTYGATNSGGDESGKILLRMGMLAFGDPSVDTAVAQRISEQPYALLQPYTPPIRVDFGGASGGTTYDVSVSDGWDVGDNAGSTAVFNISAADGVTGGDSSGGTAEFITSLTDGLVVGDTSGLSLVLTVSASDGIEAGDAASVAVSFSVSVIDGWEAGDSVGAAATLNISVTDGSVLSEALSLYSGATLSITDGFKVGDSVSAAIEWLASLTDGIVVGDTSGGTAEYVLTVSDGAAIGDVLQAVAEMAVAVSDGVSLGDTGVINLGNRVSGLARFVFRVGGLELRLVVPDKLRRLVLPEDGGDLEH